MFDESSKKFFFDTFIYKVFVYSDEKISVLLTMKDGESTQEKLGSHKSLMAEQEIWCANLVAVIYNQGLYLKYELD